MLTRRPRHPLSYLGALGGALGLRREVRLNWAAHAVPAYDMMNGDMVLEWIYLQMLSDGCVNLKSEVLKFEQRSIT